MRVRVWARAATLVGLDPPPKEAHPSTAAILLTTLLSALLAS